MPHIIVEYSANLEPDTNLPSLIAAIHEAALSTGVFPLGGLRTRAHRCDHFCISDDANDNSFIHVMLRIGAGRDEATKRRAAQTIFDALSEHLRSVFENRPLGLSLELVEIDPVTSFKKNNLHAYATERAAATRSP